MQTRIQTEGAQDSLSATVASLKSELQMRDQELDEVVKAAEAQLKEMEAIKTELGKRRDNFPPLPPLEAVREDHVHIEELSSRLVLLDKEKKESVQELINTQERAQEVVSRT